MNINKHYDVQEKLKQIKECREKIVSEIEKMDRLVNNLYLLIEIEEDSNIELLETITFCPSEKGILRIWTRNIPRVLTKKEIKSITREEVLSWDGVGELKADIIMNAINCI